MKNIFTLLLVGLCAITSTAQQSSIQGVVAIFNSEFETGKRQYVSNAQVEEDYGKSQATITSADGSFKLPLIGIKDLEQVFFSVKKPSYEVVNTDALQATAGQKESIRVYMAPEGKIAENKLTYYKINREAAEKTLTDRIARIGKDIEVLQKNASANQAKIKALQLEYAQLQEQFKKIDDNARELAERYAKTNLDDQSRDYQRAFRYFKQGQLDSALWVFKNENLEETAQRITIEQKRNLSLAQEYKERDSVKNFQKKQVNDALLFKAGLHETRFDFDQVEETYLLLLRLDSTNVINLATFAHYLAKQNQHDKAIFYYQRALGLAKVEHHKATIRNNLGAVYNDKNEHLRAQEEFKSALTIYEQLAQIDPVYLQDVAGANVNLGMIAGTLKNSAASKNFYSKALLFFSKYKNPAGNLVELESDYATLLHNFGKQYFYENQLDSAKILLQESYQLFQKQHKAYPSIYLSDVGLVENSLGDLYMKRKQEKEAKYYLKKSIETFSQLAEQNPSAYLPHLAASLIDLSSFFEAVNQLDSAIQLSNKAISIYEDLVNLNPDAYLPGLAAVYNSSALQLARAENLNEAMQQITKALDITKQLANRNPQVFKFQYAGCLQAMSSLRAGRNIFLLNKQESKTGQKEAEEALNIFEIYVQSTPDEAIPKIGKTLYALAVHQLALNDTTKALINLDKSIEIARNYLHLDNTLQAEELAISLSLKGNIFFYKHQWDSAESAFKEAYEMFLQFVKAGNLSHRKNLASTSQSLGMLYSYFFYPKKSADKAIPYYELSSNIYQELTLENPFIYLALASSSMAILRMLHEQKRDHAAALLVKKQVLSFYSNLIQKRQNEKLYITQSIMQESDLDTQLPFLDKIILTDSLLKWSQDLPKDLNSSKLFANLFYRSGYYNQQNRAFHQAIKSYKESIKYYELIKNNDLQINSYIAVNQVLIGYMHYEIAIRTVDSFSLEKSRQAKENAKMTLQKTPSSNPVTNQALAMFQELEDILNTVKSRDLQLWQKYAQLQEALSPSTESSIPQNIHLPLLEVLEELYRRNADRPWIKDNLVIHYGKRSWFALLQKDFIASEKAALRCLELDNTQEWVLTNLGHSYLLRGDFKQAQATYEKLKGKKDAQRKDYKQVLLEDFTALEKEGVTHPDMARMRAWIESW